MNEHTHIEDLAGRIRPRTASNVLLWIIAAFFALFVIWATFTKLDRSVRGQGRVIASSKMQVISNLEGGIVSAIMVRTGQTVNKGQELLRLDTTQSGSELGTGEASVDALRAKVGRLQAEMAGREPSFPAATSPELARQISVERSLHAAKIAELSSVTSAGLARVAQASEAVQEAESTYQARVAARDAKLAQVRIIRPLVERGIEPRMSLIQAQSDYDVAVKETEGAAATLQRARAGVNEARAAMAQQRQTWMSQAGAELTAAQAEMGARSQTLPALQEKVARTEVRAPLAGRINRVLVTTVGSAVPPGAPMIEIVPSHEALLVEAMVKPADIAFVRMGQRARVSITAYDPSVYGSLHGNVVAISPDATVNEKTGESYYIVQVRTDSTSLKDHYGHPLPIGTGMVADVSLLGEKRTILQYILTPITRITETAFRE
ncbi:MAG: HlyD family type secretion periplasmic adaptor subunit [Alphaproteobacteria bacterium]|nr:HlyD family type secretion periplasmic adaptor subunit [Alphaproteobacteria bacterium]MDB5719439.1 HlyD family type secretion periplasmic adaptor subunit [Alphaproteobacteria bacterium]